MRYRIDELPASEAMPTTDDVYMFTLILSVFIGILLTWMGIKGRQIWLTVWSVGLILASFASIGWVLFAS